MRLLDPVFRMEYEGQMVTVEQLAAIRFKRAQAFETRKRPPAPSKPPPVPVPPFYVELTWNREFHFVPHGGEFPTIEAAAKYAASLRDMGDGACVKKTRIVDSTGETHG